MVVVFVVLLGGSCFCFCFSARFSSLFPLLLGIRVGIYPYARRKSVQRYCFFFIPTNISALFSRKNAFLQHLSNIFCRINPHKQVKTQLSQELAPFFAFFTFPFNIPSLSLSPALFFFTRPLTFTLPLFFSSHHPQLHRPKTSQRNKVIKGLLKGD